MKTNLEDYLKNNRALLDTEEPDDDLIWSGVHQELKHKISFRFISWKTAAIALLALVCGFILNSVITPRPRTVQLTLSEISPEYARQEKIYQASIQEKWAKINSEDIKRSDYSEIFKEIDQLEQIKAETLKDFEELGGNPRMVKTLFEYYEIKIRLLEIMLAEIDKKKNNKIKTQSDEKYY